MQPYIPFSVFINITVLVVFICSVLFAFLVGWKKSVVRSATNLICGIIALLIANPISVAFSSSLVPLFHNWMRDGLGESVYNDIFNSGETLNELLNSLPSAMFAPILFFILYFLLSLIVLFFVPLFTRLIFGKNDKEKDKKMINHLYGIPLGIFNAIMIIFIILMPIAGYTNMVAQVVDNVEESNAEDVKNIMDEVDAIYSTNIEPIVENFFVKSNYKAGGKTIFDALTVFKIDGKKYNITDEINNVVFIAVQAKTLSDSPLSNYSSAQINALTNIADRADSSDLIKKLASEYVCKASTAWLGNETFLSTSKPITNGNFTKVLDSALSVFATSTPETIVADFRTLIEMLDVMVKNDAMKAFKSNDELLEIIRKQGFISSLITPLYVNERMIPIAVEIQNIGIVLVSETLGIPENNEELYKDLVDSIADSVNKAKAISDEAERKASLETDLPVIFENGGVDLPHDIIPYLSDYMLDSCKDIDYVTGDDIVRLISDVSDAYAAYNAETTTGQIRTEKKYGIMFLGAAQNINYENNAAEIFIINLISSDSGISEETLKEFNNIASEIKDGKLVTHIITMEDLLLKFDEKMSGDMLLSEAKKLEKIVFNASELILTFRENNQDGLNNILSLDPSVIENIFVAMKESTIFADKSEKMLKAIIESKTMRETGLVDKNTYNDIIEGGTDNLANKLGTIQNTASMMLELNKTVGNDTSVIEKNITWLIKNMQPSSAKMLKAQLTASKIMKYGVPAISADPMNEFLCTVLDNMISKENMTEAEYRNEAIAIKHIFDITKKLPNANKNTSIFGNAVADAEELTNMILNSKVISKALVDCTVRDGIVTIDYFKLNFNLNDTDRVAFINALETYLNEKTDNKSDEQIKVKALSGIFNIDVSINDENRITINK